ncbi:hypothetical protein ACQPZ8_42905 [Actinomadura nitritigenes]|uniref:hypothetical protein n=1 Tax=Actinomadura nitritigenes TaxID=134602 RepID=UPI003D93A501
MTGLLITVTNGSFGTGASPFFLVDEHLDGFAAAYFGVIGETNPARAHGASSVLFSWIPTARCPHGQGHLH